MAQGNPIKYIRCSKSRGAGSPDVTGFYDDATGSIQYLVADPETKLAALIDVVLGFDPKDASIDTKNMDAILEFAEREGLEIEWILDTHPHADHLMASSQLKHRLKKPNGIGEKVVDIAKLWAAYYNMLDGFAPKTDFDRLFKDGDRFTIGNLPVRVMLSPGHTLGSITYVIGTDAAFAHVTFMQPDAGTSRADFPGGSAATLYQSLQDILALPGETRIFVGHDYGTDTRAEPQWESTVAEQREYNAHIGAGVSKDAFVKLRTKRDKTLSLPDRMLHVLQMNLRAGQSPATEEDGNRYLKIPMERF